MADQGLLVEGRVLRLAIELMTVKRVGHLTPKTPPVSGPVTDNHIAIISTKYHWQIRYDPSIFRHCNSERSQSLVSSLLKDIIRFHQY